MKLQQEMPSKGDGRQHCNVCWSRVTQFNTLALCVTLVVGAYIYHDLRKEVRYLKHELEHKVS